MASRMPHFTATEQALMGWAQEQASSPVQQAALARFAREGLPHRRLEAYRYTDLKQKLAELPPLGKAEKDVKRAGSLPFDVHDIFLANGKLDIGENGQDYVSLAPQTANMEASSEVDNLNAIFAPSAGVITIFAKEAGKIFGLHHILSQNTAASHHGRFSVQLQAGAKITLIENFMHNRPGDFATSVVDFSLGIGAQLTHIILGASSGVTALLNRKITLAGKSNYQQFVFAKDSPLFRIENEANFHESSASARFDGVFLAGKDNHLDMTLMLNHEAGDCTSETNIRSLVREGGKAIFQGKVKVARGADKTDAQMLSKGTFLDDTGEIINKPELEIYAEDVICAHGATSGQFDDNQLFYLISRGLSSQTAEAMLAMAVAREVLANLENDECRQWLENNVMDWLGGDMAQFFEEQYV